MFELLGGGVLGSLIGGVFRLAPEVLKLLDKKNERAHELAMFDKQCDLEKVRGQQKLAEIGAERDLALDSGALTAFNSAIQQQTEMVKVAGKFVASLSASVRPVITYWIVALWSTIHIWFMYMSWNAGMEPTEVFKQLMTPDFAALVSGIINYWFLDRTIAKRGL